MPYASLRRRSLTRKVRGQAAFPRAHQYGDPSETVHRVIGQVKHPQFHFFELDMYETKDHDLQGAWSNKRFGDQARLIVAKDLKFRLSVEHTEDQGSDGKPRTARPCWVYLSDLIAF